MTRRIFMELEARMPVTAVCWNKPGSFYQCLGPREMEYLKTPFRRYDRPVSHPHSREDWWPEFQRLLRNAKIDLPKLLQHGDVFLVPDMFTDRRVRKLQELVRQIPAASIAIFHDAAEVQLSLRSGRRMKKFQNYIRSLASFDLVICVSDESRADLVQLWEQYGVTPRAETVVLGWPVEFQENERSDERRARPVLLYVSSFNARKNHQRLFDAANRLWQSGLEFELQLVGSSTNWGKRVAVEVGRLQRFGRPIHWLRHVDDNALHQAYRECLFTVYPSLKEGFGLPVAESLWHGKPCVCGGNGALGAVARGGGCLIVDQTSVDELAAGIRRLLLDQPLYGRLCEEARARKFRTWANYIDDLLGYLRPRAAPESVKAGRAQRL